MSLEAWKQEFYPTEACEFADDSNKTWEEALRHSIVKWRGLTEDNVDKHNLDYSFHRLEENINKDNFLDIDAESCALCQKCSTECDECPIVTTEANFGYTCDGFSNNGVYAEEFNKFRQAKHIPRIMIDLLEKTALLMHKEKTEEE